MYFGIIKALWFTRASIQQQPCWHSVIVAQETLRCVGHDSILSTCIVGGAGVPTVIICALGAGTQKLRMKGIDVLNPGKLKSAADCSVICFDKTGTLTGSVVSLLSSSPCIHSTMQGTSLSHTAVIVG